MRFQSDNMVEMGHGMHAGIGLFKKASAYKGLWVKWDVESVQSRPGIKMVDPEPCFNNYFRRPQLFMTKGLSLTNLHLPESVLIVALRFNQRAVHAVGQTLLERNSCGMYLGPTSPFRYRKPPSQ